MSSSIHSSGFSVYPPGICWEANGTCKPDNMRSVKKKSKRETLQSCKQGRRIRENVMLQAEQDQEGERQLQRTFLAGTKARSPKTILQGASLSPIHLTLSPQNPIFTTHPEV